jgi:hypothetical protein
MNIRYLLYAIILLSVITTSVSGAAMNKTFQPTDIVVINQTYTISNNPATPFIVWAAAGYLGILLLILSFFSFSKGEEGLISILAWIPLGFAMFTSFAVDVVNGSGVVGGGGTYALIENHTIYAFNTIAILYFVLLAFAIANTYRIWMDQKKMVEVSASREQETFI